MVQVNTKYLCPDTLDVVGDGVARTPVLVVEGRELTSHVGGGGWLSAKVDSEFPGPIVFLYTQDARLLPSTANWLRLSRSSDGPTEWSSSFRSPTELRLVIHVIPCYLLTRKRFYSLPYRMTSWMSHDDLLITSSDFVYSLLSCYHDTTSFFVLRFTVRALVCQDPLSRYCSIYTLSFYYCLCLVRAQLL